MSEGEGFARRVTLSNLHKFAPLLKPKRVADPDGGIDTDLPDATDSDAANESSQTDPDLAAAAAIFVGESIRTGVRFSRPSRPSRPRSTGSGASADAPASNEPAAPSPQAVLLMRVRPRRDGTQLQISMRVHGSAFMNSAPVVVSAADDSRRPIGYDYVAVPNGEPVPNTARFEAPELDGVENPVACFTWLDAEDEDGGAARILRYEIFDAARSAEGMRILKTLEEGIATPPTTNLDRLSEDETVLSKSDREIAQWYRLDSARA